MEAEDKSKGWTANGAEYNFSPRDLAQHIESELWEAARVGLVSKFEILSPVYEMMGMKWPDWIIATGLVKGEARPNQRDYGKEEMDYRYEKAKGNRYVGD